MTEPGAGALTAEELFERHFWPLYPEPARADLARARAVDANPANNPSILASLDDVATRFAHLAPTAFGQDLVLDRTDASVHRLGAAISRERRDAWARTRAEDGASLLSHVVIHGAVYVGACAVRSHGGVWQVRNPLWESLVRLQSRAGEGDLAVFQWWLKSLSDAEIEKRTLGDRYRQHVEVPTFDPEKLPPIAPPDRRMPRLAKVRYDTLHKHFRAHLPELSDLGRDFPSASRLAELDFAWLDFAWLGGGRMLLVHGPTPKGVHLFWLDAGGFVKGAFYPADRQPEHRIEVRGDVLEVVLPVLGHEQRHEMLWWGP